MTLRHEIVCHHASDAWMAVVEVGGQGMTPAIMATLDTLDRD